jgi:hypothetical protein
MYLFIKQTYVGHVILTALCYLVPADSLAPDKNHVNELFVFLSGNLAVYINTAWWSHSKQHTVRYISAPWPTVLCSASLEIAVMLIILLKSQACEKRPRDSKILEIPTHNHTAVMKYFAAISVVSLFCIRIAYIHNGHWKDLTGKIIIC